jgi:NADH-quinone oxidoreductase subunit A
MESIALLHIMLSAGVLLLLLWICHQLSQKLRPQRAYPAKATTYESGTTPVGNARSALKSPIYVLGLIFLLFELETILLFPWALVYTQPATTNPAWHLHMAVVGTMFILILGIGWVYVLQSWRRIMEVNALTTSPEVTSIIPAMYYERINTQYAGHIALPHPHTVSHEPSIPE